MIIDNIKIKGVTCDSKKIKEGYVFVAIKGEKSDGNDFIDEAINKGASIIFTENDIKMDNVLVKKVENTRETLARLCNEFYDYPTEKLKVIGVTGTNGKTTTTHLIHHMLRQHGVSTGLIGTLNIKINDREYKSQLTTPEAETIYHYLYKMVQEKVEVVVMEVSSHGLKNHRIYGINFDIGLHTNIERDHLNFHKTFDDYIASKKKLFDSLSSGKIAVINLDDDNGLKLLDGNHRTPVITYGLGNKATITASSIDTDSPTTFNYCLQRGITTLSGIEVEAFEYPIVINLLGKHNVYNSLAAITCALLMDVPIETIKKSLEVFSRVPRRMDVIYKEDYTVIDDYCHNPFGYEAVFQSVQGMQYKDLHIVNAIRGNRGVEVNYEIAETIKQWSPIIKIKNIIITASSDYINFLDLVNKKERNVFIEVFNKGRVSFRYMDRLEDSIKEIMSLIGKGDILLLLGAQGMDHGAEIFKRYISKELLQGYSSEETKDLNYEFLNHRH
mgnify:CR=1 FL=1